MKLRQAILDAERAIAALGSDEARLEAELILGCALHLDRVHLYQHLEEEIGSAPYGRFRRLLDRRLANEPTAYILGHKEFFGLDFDVSPVALIPRPETETLVDLVIAFARERFGNSPVTIADIGCGCGIIAVSLAHALPFAQLIATDINPDALELTSRNALRHDVGGRIKLALGDLLAPVQEPVDIIAANLPYVPTADWENLPPEIRDHEPRSGLDGGPDGLRLIVRLLEQAAPHIRPAGALFEEIGYEHGKLATHEARRLFPEAAIAVEKDMTGRDRILVVKTLGS